MSKESKLTNIVETNGKPSKAEAEEAVRTLISWAGDNPLRHGLIDTPARVLKVFQEHYSGYNADPEETLRKATEDSDGYQDIVILKNMRFVSHCQHHMAPIIGKAHIAYIPNKKVVGISKLARILDIFAKRLQKQEALTSQIADIIEHVLQPKGVAVIIDAEHQCMTTRGVRKHNTTTITRKLTGIFIEDSSKRAELSALIAQE